jgi:hypothetical protein
MSVISPPNPKDYLVCRERYLVAFAKYKRFGESLKLKLGATSDTEMEEAFMDPQTRTRFRADISTYGELGIEFDEASTTHDLATEIQRRLVAQQQAELRSDFTHRDE